MSDVTRCNDIWGNWHPTSCKVSTYIIFKFYSQVLVSRKQWLFASVSQHLMCMCCRWSWPWLLSADGFQTWGKCTVSCDLLGESLFTVWMTSGDFIFLSSSDCKQLLMSHNQSFCVCFSHKCSQFVFSFVPVLPPLRQRGRLESSLWKLLLINSERERKEGY